LPALYGGEMVATYNAVVVFQDPSLTFTETRWRPCTTSAQAVRIHRAIFLDWATRGKAAILFDRLDHAFGEPESTHSTAEAFFSRYYVTDIWKDAKWTGSDKTYREYWLSKLAIELGSVATRCIIFVGKQALIGRRLVPAGTPAFHVPFPRQWIGSEGYEREVDALVDAMQADVRIQSLIQ